YVRVCLRGAIAGVERFFFQAEDGIRDFHVTGVQTCALPISGEWYPARDGHLAMARSLRRRFLLPPRRAPANRGCHDSSPPAACRSEERRVGKECRSRWASEP